VLAMLSRCPAEKTPAVGVGTEYRFTGARVAGAVLVADDRVAHLMAFPAASANQRHERHRVC
jgi:hypothetical protein